MINIASAAVFLGEAMTSMQIAGAALVMAGLAVNALLGKKHREPSSQALNAAMVFLQRAVTGILMSPTLDRELWSGYY